MKMLKQNTKHFTMTASNSKRTIKTAEISNLNFYKYKPYYQLKKITKEKKEKY